MVRTSAQTTQRYPGGYIRDIPERPPIQRGRAPQVEEEEEIDIREQRPSGELPEPPLTRTGAPDRRFLGARHLPPLEETNPDYRRARTGGMVGDIHITIDGKPDRRFKENRSLSDDEVNHQWVQVLNNRYRQH